MLEGVSLSPCPQYITIYCQGQCFVDNKGKLWNKNKFFRQVQIKLYKTLENQQTFKRFFKVNMVYSFNLWTLDQRLKIVYTLHES